MSASNDDLADFSLTDTPYARLQEHFRTMEWEFETDEAREVVITSTTAAAAQFKVLATITDGDLLEVLVSYPVHAPEPQRHQAAEFCTRVTCGMRLGALHFNMENGRVNFHASAPFTDGDLPPKVIDRCVGSALVLANHYFAPLMSVMFGGVTAAHASRQADAEWNAGR